MTDTMTISPRWATAGLLLATLAMLLPGATVADDSAADDPATGDFWEMSDLKLKLRAKNATSAYSTPITREMETLLLHTVDPDQPGIAFRCEKGKMYVIVSVRAADLAKALREGVRRPRDWELTYRIDDGAPVTEDWVSMSNSRLFMARKFASTAAIFNAARNGGTLAITVRGSDPVTIDIPESHDDLFDYYVESCELDPDYDPNAGT